MKPLNKLGEQRMEDGSLWELWERDNELTLQLDGMPCASSFTYGSEQSMAEIATSPITRASQPQIMIAGIGLGYGLAKAMECLPREKAKFIVAEPVQAILEWNRTHGENSKLWQDSRVSAEVAHAADLCRKRTGSLHAILLRHVHARCELSLGDAQAYFNALKGGSLLAISIAKKDKRLESTLMRAGFEVSTTPVPASAKGKQQRMHIIVLARRGRFVPFAERQSS
ncbi:MAG: hypothetical protein IJA63_11625 [Akkermansia sp.]|nr:hypothetical protein [Akkermansia sp.]